MHTYGSIVASAIILLFASAAYSAPAQAESYRQNEQHKQHKQKKQHKKHAGERRVAQEHHGAQKREYSSRGGHQGGHKAKHHGHGERAHGKSHNHSKHYKRQYARSHYSHPPHRTVSWYVNLGLTPGYSNANQSVYFRWDDYENQCFRVEERRDRTVWVEVPSYKCF